MSMAAAALQVLYTIHVYCTMPHCRPAVHGPTIGTSHLTTFLASFILIYTKSTAFIDALRAYWPELAEKSCALIWVILVLLQPLILDYTCWYLNENSIWHIWICNHCVDSDETIVIRCGTERVNMQICLFVFVNWFATCTSSRITLDLFAATYLYICAAQLNINIFMFLLATA